MEALTVAELIEVLSKLPPDRKVINVQGFHAWRVVGVEDRWRDGTLCVNILTE